MSSPGSELLLGALLTLSIGSLPPIGIAWVLPVLYFLLLFLGQGAVVLLAYRMPSYRPEEASDAPVAGSLSVIIPARNEREDLALCLTDLAAQDFVTKGGVLEILVVDGGSTDGTAEMARRHPANPRVIEEPPLPSGWVGKNWACHLGRREARGERLLFLDADTRLAPSTLRVAWLHQQATGADLVTLAARIVMEGFWERVVMPLYVQFVLIYFVTPRVNVDTSSRAMANGQFMLFTTEGYAKGGGHERVRGAVLEDVRMAQELKRAGGKVRVLWAPELLTTRMYAERREMDEGILKNLHGTRFSTGRQVALAAGIFLFFLSPFVILVLAVVGALSLLWLVVALSLVALTLLKQVGFQRALGAPLADGLLYPLGCSYYLLLFARSIHRGWSRGKVAWKGREYSMDRS